LVSGLLEDIDKQIFGCLLATSDFMRWCSR